MAVKTKSLSREAAISPPPKARWSWPHYFALIGVPILFWELWTIVAYLADGPSTVRWYGPRNDVEFFVAKAHEALGVVVAIAVITYVVRGCRRAHRVVTFDVMFCIAGFSIFWQDLGVNFFMPSMLISSYYVNIANLCGHIPFVVNPDCGRVPDPIIMWILITFGALGLAIVAEPIVRRARRRWPDITDLKVFGLIIVGAAIFDLVWELGFMITFHQWAYPVLKWGWSGLRFNHGAQYTLTEFASALMWFAAIVALRLFKDDRGRTFLERGLERHSARTQKVITFMALYCSFQLISMIPGNLPGAMTGPFQKEWPALPSHLLNGVCDAPGVQGTRYGPCPGSPGFRLPMPGSLPGKSP